MPNPDIRNTGALNWRALQQQNDSKFDPATASEEDQMKMATRLGKSLNSFSPKADEGVGIQAAQLGYGESQYDDAISSLSQLENIGEVRYAEQPWYDTLANGIGKMLGTAGTTFISSLVGLPYGAIAAANEGRWSALWDNDVTQGLADVDDWLEENMTNYRSQVQQNSPWWSKDNLMSMNFIADDVIKNAGFTLGAAASMSVGSGSLGLMSRALGFVNNVSKGTKMGQAALSALFSATGEGMIEARQGVEERNKLEMQRLDDALSPEYNALEMQREEINQRYALTNDYATYRQQMQDLDMQKQALDEKKAAGQQQIIDSGMEMGNKILLANQGLLTMGNLIQFGKGMVKSFDRARHAAEVSSKAVKPSWVNAERISNNIKDGYKITGKNFGKVVAGGKGLVTEGSEEMNQQWIQSSAGASVNEADVNDYWKAKLDPESYRETTKGLYTIGSILDRGFDESWGDPNQWEQFVIGGITGLAGSYTPTKLFNQDKTKSRWNPMRYGSWEGGAYNSIRDFNKEYQQYAENVDELNKILQSEDFPARVQSMTGHTYTESQKMEAVEGDDKKSWKDADDKQFIHDVQTFLRAGKLDDLRAIYNEIGSQMSEEDVENIIKSTTREVSAEEDKQNYDAAMDERIAAKQREVDSLYDELESLQNGLLGSTQDAYDVNRQYVNEQSRGILASINAGEQEIAELQQQKQDYVGQKYYEGAYVDRQGNRTATDDELKKEVKHNADELNRKLDSYLESIDYVNRRTNGQLTKDQEDNLAYLHNMGKESNVRMQKIMAGVRSQLPSRFLLKTNKTPEQLNQENASSDLTFYEDENTKEGYVEVDTSMMNDAAFADFFQREVMRGGNIRPEFAETADERAAREEEEKNLSEDEKKRRTRERATKKWNSAIQQMQNDAEEQWDVNWKNLVDNFMNNFRKDGTATLDETIEAFSKVKQDLQDASDLYDQAGEFQRTLMEYMANPSLVDRDKAKEENKAQQAEDEKQAKNKFAGKDSRQIKQEIADGTLDIGDLDEFAVADLSNVTDEDVKAAQPEAKKAQESMQKASALKSHIQEQLSDNPTQAELEAAEMAMNMVDQAMLAADNPSDISISMPELNQVPIDNIPSNATLEDIDALNTQVQDMLANAFNALEEDEQAQNDIPEGTNMAAVAENKVSLGDTGHDATTKTKPDVVAPSSSPSSKAASDPIPQSPLTEGAVGTIIESTKSLYDKPSLNGTWRSTTTRHPYEKSTGTYHETLPDKNSIEYKRSKAIWEGFNETGVFDRQDNSDNDRINSGDTVHFMVSYLPEVFDADFDEIPDDKKPYAMVIIMLNDNGEPIGDLPLAELEPSFKAGNPTQQVKDLKSLQDKVFKAFIENRKKTGSNASVVDSTLHLEGADNLNLTFDGSKKPLVSRVKQVMKGVVPYRYGEINTLNEVAQGTPELAVKITGSNVALKRGDKAQHKDIAIPSVGNVGQPYMLLPTPSGEKIAVPFYMPAFNAEQHRNTELYKMLSNAVYYLLTNNSQATTSQKNDFLKHLDIIEGLLQVKRQEGKKVVEVKSDSVILHLQSLTDPNQKIDLAVSNASGNSTEIAKALVDKMSGIPINVSLQFLNDKIETGDGRKADYNRVIGEIANVNLPKATKHTTNGWFTIELAPSAGIKPSKRVTPKTTGKFTENIGGRNIEIDTDKLIAIDTATGEIIDNDEQVALRLAEVKASKPQYKDKDFIQVSVNGELRTYDVKNKKFAKTQKTKTESPVVSFARQIKNADTVNALVDIQKAATEAQGKGTLSANDLIQITGLINQKRTSMALENSDVSEVAAPTRKVSFSQPQATAKPQAKTIEQIDNEMKQKKVVGRQSKDAWDAIPDTLKLKMFNEAQALQLSYNNKTVTISASNLGMMTKALQDANMAAKAGNLKVTEVAKPMEKDGIAFTRENEQSVRRWLTRNLPMLSSEERTQFVEKITQMGENAGKYWGSYRSGVIQIQRNAPEGTVYHEAFHYVLDMILDPEERKQVIEIAKKEYGLTDGWAAEERLANDFRKYALDENATGITGVIKRWLRRIKDKMNRYNRISDTTVNQLFWKINNGGFANKLVTLEGFEENQQRVLGEIRNVQKENYSWNNLDRESKSSLKDSGISEKKYNEMSLEEKQQYVKCRG